MRFTFGTYKFAVRTPGFTLAGAGDPPRFATTSPSIQKAVREYHVAGGQAARTSLRDSLSGPYWRSGRGATMASIAKDLLEQYMKMDRAQGKVAASFDLKSDVSLGPNVVGVNIDVCVFEAHGYGARLVLWDTRGCTPDHARLLLAPCVVALEQEMGSGTAESAEVWHMRTPAVLQVSPSAARRSLREAGVLLQRIQQ